MKRFALILLLALVAAAVPSFAASTWTASAVVETLHGEITSDGVVLTAVVLNDGGTVFTARCNTDPREVPQVCAGLVAGNAYDFWGTLHGDTSGAVVLQVDGYSASEVVQH